LPFAADLDVLAQDLFRMPAGAGLLKTYVDPGTPEKF